jgi:hypothetical protein
MSILPKYGHTPMEADPSLEHGAVSAGTTQTTKNSDLMLWIDKASSHIIELYIES